MSLALLRRGSVASARRRVTSLAEGFVGAPDPASTLPITLRSSHNLKYATEVTATPSFTIPADAEGGDLVVAVAGLNTNTTTLLPPTITGWTLAGVAQRSGIGTCLAVYSRVVTGTPGSLSPEAGTTVTMTNGTNNRSYSIFTFACKGSQRTPKVRTNASSAGSYHFAPRLTGIRTGALVISASRTVATSPHSATEGDGSTLASAAGSSTGAFSMSVRHLPQAADGETGYAKFIVNGAYDLVTVVVD